MYRYARTRNRVHRVVIEGGRAFKVEQCNLDDVGFLNLVDIVPEGQKCAYCWAGYVEPTPEQKAAESAENAKREEQVKEQIPAGAKAIPLVTSTRRMAAAALVAALALGAVAGGALAGNRDVPTDPSGQIDDLRHRVDDLIVQVRILTVDVNGHVHEPAPSQGAVVGPVAPIVIVLPTPAPASDHPDPTGEPTADPTAKPTDDASSKGGGGDTTVIDRTTTVIVVVPTAKPGSPDQQTAPTPRPTAQPTPAPTAAPTPVPSPSCFRPNGKADPCKWPHQP